MTKLGRMLPLVLVLALFAAACGGDDDGAGGAGGGRTGGSATAFLEEPDALDPMLSTTTTSFEVVSRVFDALIDYDPKTAEPKFTAAAESVQISDDATTLTYKLREGATFHNGEPVNAEAFVRGLTRVALKENASQVAYHLAGIKGFDEAQAGTSKTLPGVHQGANEHELVIELDAPNAEFFVRTGHLVYSPVPQAALDDAQGFNRQPIGNGPYKMDGPWRAGQEIRVSRFEGYNGEQKGLLDRITWRLFAEEEQGYLEFQGGTLDTTEVPEEQFAAVADQYGDAFIQQLSAIFDYLGFNAKEITNVKFRQAVSLAIDREAINKAVFNGQRIPANAVVPPTSQGHRPGACKLCRYDPQEAKRLFQESGVGNASLTFTFNAGAGHDAWVTAAAEQVKKNLGVNTTVRAGSTDFGTYLKGLTRLEGAFRLGWAQDFPSPHNWLYPFYHSKSGDNYLQYSNPRVDRLLDQAARTVDDDARLRLQQQVEDIVLEEMPLVPMFFRKSSVLYNKEKFDQFVVDVQSGNPYWEQISVKQ